MMSLNQINEANREAAVTAAVDNSQPFVVTDQDITDWRAGRGLPVPFPYIGDYEPEGFEPVGDALFIDVSGFGQSDEPALTIEQTLNRLVAGNGYAFTELGQFQAYLQPYRVTQYRTGAVNNGNGNGNG